MMDKHFTITIHDESGVRQFNLHKFVKRAVLYTLSFIVIVAVFSVGMLFYLNENLQKIEVKKEQLQKNYELLKKEHMILQKRTLETQQHLEAKQKELAAIGDSLSEIETLIGLKPLAKESLPKRISLAKLSSQQRATLLELIPSGSPIKYEGITSSFGYRIHPITKKREYHRGIDLRAKMNTPVYATADGIVEWAGYHKRSGFGNLIILVHMFGFKAYFGHLKKVVVKSGDFVRKGALIGYSGNSGLSNGPHLHYELRFINRVLNPYYFIKWTQQNYEKIFQKEKKVPWQSLIIATTHIKVVSKKAQQPSLPSDAK